MIALEKFAFLFATVTGVCVITATCMDALGLVDFVVCYGRVGFCK
jgi:hypothetical protein